MTDRRIEELEKDNDRMEIALRKIENWCKSYPLEVFPEPDLKKAAKILRENGMTLDSIGASSMRHVLKGITKLVQEGLRKG